MQVGETAAPVNAAESAPAVEPVAAPTVEVEAAPRLRGVGARRASRRPAATPPAPVAAVDWGGRVARAAHSPAAQLEEQGRRARRY